MVVFSIITIVAFGRQQRAAVQRGAVETLLSAFEVVGDDVAGEVLEDVFRTFFKSVCSDCP